MCECGLRFVVSRSMWHMATYSTCGTVCVQVCNNHITVCIQYTIMCEKGMCTTMVYHKACV